ncbi:mannan endo-1,4-beta-mannosidase 7-like [Impatiens glandulifera]|uniref:mannan endo-1,4-beta-mannosidase 7-like n=1 Tax=Impatiens glandulifera TaxID=253017 RepID=UPI001FB11E4E|nr:mannan endo-1,4-beta-mannosidase 7-like [Impatiens glandulifera]
MRNLNVALFLLCSAILITNQEHQIKAESDQFIRTKGVQFILNGNPFYANGFNAYWLMYTAAEPSERNKVTSAFSDAGKHGLSIVRTWAFNDGNGYRALQTSPGVYNEQVFQGLDFAVSEAGKYGMKVILCLVNNYKDFGGRNQYVEWGRSKGEKIDSEDGFYSNGVVKEMFKNHIKMVVNRRNTITGIVYKDDPNIMAWELINEPRCPSDQSGSTIQSWIKEMAAYVKSLDNNHMVDIGMEGFYGPSRSERQQNNPNFLVGTDFIANNQIQDIDFATTHTYPDAWFKDSSNEIQNTFLNNWVNNHLQDAENILKKPLMFAEFGQSNKLSSYNIGQRDKMFETIYSTVYMSSIKGGAAAGGLFWHLLTTGMDNLRDGYEIILSENSTTNSIIAYQSKKLKKVRHLYACSEC